MLEVLGSWLWNAPTTSTSPAKKSPIKKSPVKTRAQQVAAKPSTGSSDYYPGLVNISGTYCFLNSTLQALASLSYLQPYVEYIHAKAEIWDIPTPVTDTILKLLSELNTPHSNPTSIRPIDVINALSAPNPNGTRSRLFSSREHQDAQELFQLLSSLVQEEAEAVDKESLRDPGFAAFDRELSPEAVRKREAAKGVFEGLTANRRSCVECGYTEAVMHFSFDNLTLPVPRANSCALEDCLAEYTHIELLEDCICQKCSMVATLKKVSAEAERLSVPSKRRMSATSMPDEGDPSSSAMSSARRKRAREARKLQSRVQEALDEGRIEQEIKGLKLEKVRSSASTKQAMIARPPPILVLHLNRSNYYGHGFAAKNSCMVMIPEILDLTPFTTSGALSTAPSAPISAHSFPSSSRSPLKRSSSTTPTLYRLAGVVCHYGAHSFGHYIAFRRKPKYATTSNGPKMVLSPRLACPVDCSCEKCAVFGPVRDEDEVDVTRPRNPLGGWLRISDDSVDEVGLDRVLKEGSGAFMVYYEKVLVDDLPSDDQRLGGMKSTSSVNSFLSVSEGYGRTGPSPRSSEETITPENVMVSSPRSPPDLGSSWELGDDLQASARPNPVQSKGKVKESDGDLITPLSSGRSTPHQLSRSSSTSSARVVRSVFAGRRVSREMSQSSGMSINLGDLKPPPSPAGSSSTKILIETDAPRRDEPPTPTLSTSLPVLSPTTPTSSNSQKVTSPLRTPVSRHAPISPGLSERSAPSRSVGLQA